MGGQTVLGKTQVRATRRAEQPETEEHPQQPCSASPSPPRPQAQQPQPPAQQHQQPDAVRGHPHLVSSVCHVSVSCS